MSCDFYIWDTEEEEFLSTHFSTFLGAESYIENCLRNDFERYQIFEKLS